MSKDMKLIFEGWRSQTLLEDEPEPTEISKVEPSKSSFKDAFKKLKKIAGDDDIPLDDSGKLEAVSVKDFLTYFSDVGERAEFYDKMDNEINSFLEKNLSNFIKTDEARASVTRLIGKTFRGTVGALSGLATGALIAAIVDIILAAMDVGEVKRAVAKKSVELVAGTIVGQYLAEEIEQLTTNLIKKKSNFMPGELGNKDSDAGRAFSVSPQIVRLLDALSDEFEEKLSSKILMILSRELLMVQGAIERDRKNIVSSAARNPALLASALTKFYKLPITSLTYFDEEITAANTTALEMIADEIGVKKIELSESKQRRRIVYRGKK